MALSEQEQRMLEEIEQALIADDPAFAERNRTVTPGGVSVGIRSIAVFLLGLCVLIGGIALAQTSLWFVILGLVGFFIMFAGGLMAFRSGNKPGGKGSKKANGGGPKASGNSGGIADRMENSFRRRFD